MGLDATVMCNCYFDGLIVKPIFADYIILDEEGYLDLDISFNENPELFNQFYAWMQSACVHEGMDYAREYISNWTGYRSFQQTLSDIGWHKFPIMEQELPNANGGLTSAEQASQILNELNHFSQQNLGEKYVLVDADSDKEIYEYIISYGGRFILNGTENLDLGIDKKGFFIHKRKHAKDNVHELFRSTNFKQILLEPELKNQSKRWVRYVDNISGLEFECASPISGSAIPWPDGAMQNKESKFRFSYPRNLYTEWRERKSSDFLYIVEPLKRICTAAIEAGSPIRWC